MTAVRERNESAWLLPNDGSRTNHRLRGDMTFAASDKSCKVTRLTLGDLTYDRIVRFLRHLVPFQEPGFGRGGAFHGDRGDLLAGGEHWPGRDPPDLRSGHHRDRRPRRGPAAR